MGEWDLNFELKKVVVKLDSNGIEKLLKGKEINSALEEVAKDLKREVASLTETPHSDWKVKKHERKSRSTYVVYTNDEDQKWREAYTGKIAKWLQKQLIRGKVKR